MLLDSLCQDFKQFANVFSNRKLLKSRQGLVKRKNPLQPIPRMMI